MNLEYWTVPPSQVGGPSVVNPAFEDAWSSDED